MTRQGKEKMKVSQKPSPKVETITPARAREYLRLNVGNRPMDMVKVRKLTDAMKRQAWQPKGRIVFTNGILTNGQHRLSGIVKSGATYKLPVVRERLTRTVLTATNGGARSAKKTTKRNPKRVNPATRRATKPRAQVIQLERVAGVHDGAQGTIIKTLSNGWLKVKLADSKRTVLAAPGEYKKVNRSSTKVVIIIRGDRRQNGKLVDALAHCHWCNEYKKPSELKTLPGGLRLCKKCQKRAADIKSDKSQPRLFESQNVLFNPSSFPPLSKWEKFPYVNREPVSMRGVFTRVLELPGSDDRRYSIHPAIGVSGRVLGYVLQAKNMPRGSGWQAVGRMRRKAADSARAAKKHYTTFVRANPATLPNVAMGYYSSTGVFHPLRASKAKKSPGKRTNMFLGEVARAVALDGIADELRDLSKSKPRRRKATKKAAKSVTRRSNASEQLSRAATPKLAEIFAGFQGRETDRELLKQTMPGTPDHLGQLGGLKEIKFVDGRLLTFNPQRVVLSVDSRGRFHVAGLRYTVNGKYPRVNQNLGRVFSVTYYTQKMHLGDRQKHAYEHKLGDEGGKLPTLRLVNGYLKFKGGGYYIRPEGIRN